MTTKADLVWDIATRLGVEVPHMSTGSTEPRQIFDQINDVLGLGLPSSLTKPEMARAIVEATGSAWLANYESRGGTVTREGLEAVSRSVADLLGG